jgi:FkbM family methyltransferase
MVEVGAARPDFLSIGSYFRKQGWRVISIEPNPVFAKMHRDLGHEIYQCACGERNDDQIDFTVVDHRDSSYEGGPVSFESWSSIAVKPNYKAMMPPQVGVQIIKVQLRTLDSVLEEAGVDKIDMIAVDVEGWELEVMRGLDLARFNPVVVVLENLFHEQSYIDYMSSKNFVMVNNVHPNDIYLRRHSWPE